MQLAEVVCIVCFLQRDLQFCKIFVGVHDPRKGKQTCFTFDFSCLPVYQMPSFALRNGVS